MVSKKKMSLKQIDMNSKIFKKDKYLNKIPSQIGIRKIIQEANKKALKTKTVHTRKVYTKKNKHLNSKGMEF
jgi:hypothetical protein